MESQPLRSCSDKKVQYLFQDHPWHPLVQTLSSLMAGTYAMIEGSVGPGSFGARFL